MIHFYIFRMQYTTTVLRRNPNYAIYYNNWTRLLVLGIIPAGMLIYFNYKESIIVSTKIYTNIEGILYKLRPIVMFTRLIFMGYALLLLKDNVIINLSAVALHIWSMKNIVKVILFRCCI